MKIRVWGNFVWWSWLIEGPVFEPATQYGQDTLETAEKAYAMKRHMDSKGSPWTSVPVCVTIEIPAEIEADMPKLPDTAEATATVEVG